MRCSIPRTLIRARRSLVNVDRADNTPLLQNGSRRALGVRGGRHLALRQSPERSRQAARRAPSRLCSSGKSLVPAQMEGTMRESPNAEWTSAQPMTSALLERVRNALAADASTCASLEHMAKHLAVSRRTLQRRLSESRTTFRQEVALAKVRSAQRLLIQTDLSVTRIAISVGFASSQSFARQFSRFIGNSPRGFRAFSSVNRRHRGSEENGASGNAGPGGLAQDDCQVAASGQRPGCGARIPRCPSAAPLAASSSNVTGVTDEES